MCLADAIRQSEGRFSRAFLVLGGNGWHLRKFFTEGGLEPFLNNCEDVAIMDLESFVGRANTGML
ncbi:MAG: hypothetical protein L3K23_08840 [Thermoplasmata archaeon]|nr:hypothetical protein [Thermoplasmata archaeon]